MADATWCSACGHEDHGPLPCQHVIDPGTPVDAGRTVGKPCGCPGGPRPAPGSVETAVVSALRVYPKLVGMQAPLAQMAVRLARAYDGYEGSDLTKLARLNQELRQTLQVIAEVGRDDGDGDEAARMSTPVYEGGDQDGSSHAGS